MSVGAGVDTPLAPLKRGSVGVGIGCIGGNYGVRCGPDLFAFSTFKFSTIYYLRNSAFEINKPERWQQFKSFKD